MSKAITTFLLTIWAVLAYGLPGKNDSLRYEILLTSKILDDIHLNEKFSTSIDITSNRLILLSTNDRFYLLGWGGIKAIGQQVAAPISSFAYTPDGFLMIVRNKELCYMDSLGNLSRLFGLPSQSMGISAGKYVMYLYDRNKGQYKNALYVIAKGGKYAKLFEVPTPLNSVVEINTIILFATENAIYSFNPKSKVLKPIIILSREKEIKSIAVDTLSNRIYFSTETAIYAVKDSSMATITNEFGGVLRYFNNGLLIFNPEKKLLIRMVGINDKITSEIQALKAASNSKPASDAKVENRTQKATVEPGKPALTKNETPVQPAPVPVKETIKQPVPENSGSPRKEIHIPANTIRAEKFISNTTGNLEKGKTYILKKDFSHPIDFLNNFPDGSVLKLVGSDASLIKSWKVVQPSDGSFALIDSQLYTYFEQAHVWLLKSTP